MWFPSNRTLTLQDVKVLCSNLHTQLNNKNIDCVVSVETGGWYIGEILSNILKVPHQTMTVRRLSDDEVATVVSKFKYLPQVILILYLAFLQKLRNPTLRNGLINSELIQGKNVLLVDDVIDSGKTIKVAYDYLQSLDPGVVNIAVMAVVRYSSIACVSILKGYYCYPWSKISAEYSVFWKLRSRKFQLESSNHHLV